MKISTRPGTPTAPIRLGRPRSDLVTRRIQTAVFAILERGDYAQLTMDGIAARARVSRPALYRRHSNVSQVVLAALLAAGPKVLPMPAKGDLHADLQSYLHRLVKLVGAETVLGRALRLALAGAQTDEELRPTFRDFIHCRRQPVRDRLAAEKPSLADEQIEHILDMIFGPILYRLFIRQVDVTPRDVSLIVTHALAAAGSKG